MKELQNLRDILCDELKEYGKSGDKLSAGSLATIDTLAHALKNLDKVIDDDDGYSGHYPYYGGSYDMGGRGSYHGSYARRRDSMGRYSGERGYSRSDLSDKLRELMDEAPDDRTRQEIHRMVEKLDA